MDSPLQPDFQYYLDHQDEMVDKYEGKVVVIKNGQVLGSYETEVDAVNETMKKHKVGSFLIQRVTPGAAAYSQTFHSRVTFS